MKQRITIFFETEEALKITNTRKYVEKKALGLYNSFKTPYTEKSHLAVAAAFFALKTQVILLIKLRLIRRTICLCNSL